ncbi:MULTISPECIES: DUF131 domain-containing protein [Acidianus]|uniref:DUF131 domain-containing protein n=1 Tax=Candidatus Acidianus copahuensis TaxID=1160895 RepID=A0A031LNL6_9CREN|nr:MULTISPECIES: DUF131 domain-containing protein [Acidianus]EZQ03144.1 hypothetical protein CM19_09965 [Candidatus Acidianus copahuensis]NON62209.1 DUF131 domain-containing protein [Acidianus sp. RZ1]
MRLTLVYLGILIILLGIILIFIGGISSTPSSISQPTSVAYGGVVLLGPFPIFFGVGPKSELFPLLIFGIIFTIIAVIFYLYSFYIFRRSTQGKL